jgi:hypothetical protein
VSKCAECDSHSARAAGDTCYRCRRESLYRQRIRELEATLEKERKTLRDEFAMAAVNDHGMHRTPEWVAQHAYAVADAMLAERGK